MKKESQIADITLNSLAVNYINYSKFDNREAFRSFFGKDSGLYMRRSDLYIENHLKIFYQNDNEALISLFNLLRNHHDTLVVDDYAYEIYQRVSHEVTFRILTIEEFKIAIDVGRL